MRRLLLLALSIVAGPIGAGAAELHVPAGFASVDAALNAAQPGDEIIVGPGSFPLATSRTGLQVTIRGAGTTATVLDGSGSTILALTDSQVTLEDLTLHDGADGISAIDSDVIFDSVRVELCSDGVDIDFGSSLTARSSEFVNNSDDGIDLDQDSELECFFCRITDKETTASRSACTRSPAQRSRPRWAGAGSSATTRRASS